MADSGRTGNDGIDVGSVSLQTFKNRMDELLKALEESPAQHKKIGEQTIADDAYGTGFAAAGELSKGYAKVRARLEELSRMFGEQIEGMGIAVQMADKGYTGIDADEEARFRAIQKRTQEYYERSQGGTGADGGVGTPDKTKDSGTDTGDTGGLS